MTTAATVRGPVELSELGNTPMHERIVIAEPEALRDSGGAFGECYWDEEVRVADTVAKLGAIRTAGIRTLVDPTAPGLGGFIPPIQRTSESVDLNVIVASGPYAFLALRPRHARRRATQADIDETVRRGRTSTRS